MSQARQTLWAEMRRRKQFTVAELYPGRPPSAAAYDYLAALIAAGYVRREDRPARQGQGSAPYRYSVVRDAGVDAPRLRRNGSVVTTGKARENLWRVIRILRDFNATEARIAADTPLARVSNNEARRYITHLCRAGYLICIQPKRPGVLARYRLIRTRNTGPRPPMVQANGNIFDPNLGRVVWTRPVVTEQEGCDG